MMITMDGRRLERLSERRQGASMALDLADPLNQCGVSPCFTTLATIRRLRHLLRITTLHFRPGYEGGPRNARASSNRKAAVVLLQRFLRLLLFAHIGRTLRVQPGHRYAAEPGAVDGRPS